MQRELYESSPTSHLGVVTSVQTLSFLVLGSMRLIKRVGLSNIRRGAGGGSGAPLHAANPIDLESHP